MHRESSEWKQRCTWAVIHNALSRNEVRAQMMDTKHSSHASKSNTKSSHVTIQ